MIDYTDPDHLHRRRGLRIRPEALIGRGSSILPRSGEQPSGHIEDLEAPACDRAKRTGIRPHDGQAIRYDVEGPVRIGSIGNAGSQEGYARARDRLAAGGGNHFPSQVDRRSRSRGYRGPKDEASQPVLEITWTHMPISPAAPALAGPIRNNNHRPESGWG
jgi:hypothetical protein